MGIFDRFPYSSTHEMNLDFMLGKATEIAESLQEIDTHKEQAEQAATNAAQSAQSAAQAAQAAAGSQTAAGTSASQAAQHKADAEDAADRAEAASDLADEAVEQAQTAATTAGTAAQTASTAAQNASTAADGAIASAAAAETRINTLAASLPEDFTDLNNEVNNLKSALNDVYIPSENLYNQATDRHGININGSGVITADDNYKASDYIYVGASNKVTIQALSDQQRIVFYTTNEDSGFSRALWITGTDSQTFTVGATENYIVITMLETCPDFMLNDGDTLLPYSPYGGEAGTFLQNVIGDINDNIESVRNSSVQKNIINRFNPSTITEGKYISTSDGTLLNNNSFFASDYIYIGDLESVTVSYTHIFGWYDANKNWIGHPDSMNSRSNDLSYPVPNNAVYLRFSAYTGDVNIAQIGENITRTKYVPYGLYSLADLRISPSQITGEETKIIVDASGNGDYTSFTQAIYDTVDSGIDVLVKPGTYDIVAEYVALFGQSAVDSMADSDSAIFNGFQYGVRLRKRKVEFAPGAHLVCDWTGHTVDGTHRFSALGVDYNCKIVGLDLDATATFYCIHDDYGLSDVPYTVEYENCRVIGHNINNADCIGGGCKKYSRHIIKNCYFNNNLTNSATVRYHNTNDEGAEPEIYVSNCYFNNWFTPRWYGTQTSKMRVYVNNCEARSIHKLAESSSYNVDNVELYKWCNIETDPVT